MSIDTPDMPAPPPPAKIPKPARRPERTEVVEPEDVQTGAPTDSGGRGRRTLARPTRSSGTGLNL